MQEWLKALIMKQEEKVRSNSPLLKNNTLDKKCNYLFSIEWHGKQSQKDYRNW